MKTDKLAYLVGKYVLVTAEVRLAQARKKLLKELILSRLKEKVPVVVAGWRLLKGWRKGGMRHSQWYEEPHWSLDIRRDTKPLSKAKRP